MTITYAKIFAPTTLPITALLLATVPLSPSTTLLRGARVRLTNTTATAASATLYAVPAGGTASPGNAFVAGKSIAANDFLDVDVPIMAAGDFLQALAGTASAITIHMISGSFFS